MGTREFYRSVDSTQRLALHLAREGAEEGTRVVAAEQTGGRGRSDHQWESPKGGLYLSVVERAPPEPNGLVALDIGAHLRAGLSQRGKVDPVLKWPNDLLVVERPGVYRKLGGTLIDLVPSPTLGDAIVIGIGINVAATPASFPAGLRERVVGLAELVSAPITVDEVESVALSAANHALADLADPSRRDHVLSDCRAALYGIGLRATVDGTLTGTISALGEEGELWLATASGEVAIRSGDLVVEASP